MSTTAEQFFGGGMERTVTGTTQIYFSEGRVHTFNGTSNYNIKLDSPRPKHKEGGPYWILINNGSSAMTIQNHLGVTQFSLQMNRLYKVFLTNRSTPTWIGHAHILVA
jgi:hypothetical protein